MKIGFLVQDIVNISGGSNVILEYAAGLKDHGHEVVLITPEPVDLSGAAWHPRLSAMTVLPLQQASALEFDVVFATWWLTFFNLWRVKSRIYGYLNQSLESRFHSEPHYKLLNRLTYAFPVLFFTEARWIAEFIGKLQPDAPLLYIQNGLSRQHFPPVAVPPVRAGRLRVLVEGPWPVDFKNVPDTFAILEEASKRVDFEVGWLASNAGGARPTVGGRPVELFERLPIDRVRYVLQQYDVMIKLSRVEGMFGPPLEMFSQGGTAITYPVTGHDEYMVHGRNSLVVEPYNRGQIPQYLQLLQRSPELLHALRLGALKTAREYPDWPECCAKLHSELERLEREGYTNAHLRSSLAAVATLKENWLNQVWRNERGAPAAGPPLRVGPPEIGQGERLLLERYRRLKQAAPIRGVQGLVTPELKRRLRGALTKVIS